MKRLRSTLPILLFLFNLLFPIQQTTAQLVNPNATAETLALKHLLDSLYGHKIIAGQCDDQYLSYIENASGGRAPALMGYDFNGICPSQGGNNDAAKAIRWVKDRHGIAQFQWHWISPNADGDWSSPNFNLAEALADTNSDSYHNMIRDIDLVANAFKQMQDSAVPALWRPLHEAEGAWFWWGFSGKDACIELYRLMYDRMVNHHQLNNLIWVWNSYGYDKPNWYPGDDVVDIIAWDYPRYTGTNHSWHQFQQIFPGNGKLFGIGEDGHLFDPELFAEQPWLYFMTWAYMIEDNNTPQWINQVYNDPRVFTLDDLNPGPKARAGTSRILFDHDGNGFESTTLNGSASSTNQGTITSFVWSENGIQLAEGVEAFIELPLGIHVITLSIMTSTGETANGSVVITVKKPSLSLLRPHEVSSTEANLGNISSNALDGDESTRWSSMYSDPQWFEIDLGESFLVQEVVLKWEVASAKSFKIEVSDNGTAWTSLVNKTNMPSGARTDHFTGLNSTGRYIRMYGTQRNTNYGYSLYEFEVYGIAANGIGEDRLPALIIHPTVLGIGGILHLTTDRQLRNARFSITDCLGREVYSDDFEGNQKEIYLQGLLRQGVYVLSILTPDLRQSARFIVP